MIQKYSILALLLFSAVVSSQELLRSTSSWDGGSFEYPRGEPEIVSVKLSLKKGVPAPFHCHPIPTMGYVSKGIVEVETQSGDKAILHEGDSVVEVMRTVHRGRPLSESAEIIVFYASAVGIPHTVLPEDDPESKHCK